MNKKHYVYILLTENNTLYCGYTDDVEKRFAAHLDGKGAKYTKANKPVKILWQKEFATKQEVYLSYLLPAAGLRYYFP